jgi:RNA polymerase sigma-70 factor, ECF subfamily
MNARAMPRLLPEEAFIAELEAHRRILYKVASLYCANMADRQDLTQEIVLQLWRSWPRFDGRSRFATWMYRVALNVAISWVRQDRRRSERIVALGPEVLDARAADVASGDLPAELQVLVTQVLARLPGLDRALLLLYLEGHDHAAIAGILGISATNVATKINRLKQALEKEMGP